MANEKLKKHVNYLKTDFRGEISWVFDSIRNTFCEKIFIGWCRWKFSLRGVDVGENVKFRGNMYISRHQGSLIRIGHNCSFVSSHRFNFRGITHPCILQTGTADAKIVIGRRCGFSGVSIVADNEILIGDNVMVGANTLIGDRDDHPERLGTQPSKIHIQNNVFIGMHCKIMKGVTIGENSIIGAGSIVTKDIPANSIAAGIPCKIIKNRLT